MKRRTNFDLYLEEQLKDPDFAERFKKAGEAWEVTLLSVIGQKTPRFRGSVPTEAELARREGRSYEPASALLARIKAERQANEPSKRVRQDRSARNRKR
jgi:hypothetical protein